jgi:glutamate dehydrogenase
MTNEVGQLVLMDNYKQTQILTIETQSKYDRTNLHAWFIKHLESRGELERKIEYLPSQDELNKLLAEKKRLTRPEVSVLVAYAKNSATSMLVKHDISKEKLMHQYLYAYFPGEFQKKYPNLIASHKLKNEILATVLVNDFINTMGCTCFHQLHDDLGASAMDIISAYVAVKQVFNIDEYWKKVEKLSSQVPIALKLALFNEIQQFIERNILWLLNQGQMKNLDEIAHMYITGIAALRKKIKDVATPVMLEGFKNSLAAYVGSKEAMVCANEIFSLKMLLPAFDIVSTAKNIDKDIATVAKVFFQIGEKLSLSWLLAKARDFVARQYFQIVALRTLITEMHEIHAQLTRNQMLAGKDKKSVLERCTGAKMDKYVSFIDDLKSGDTTDAFISKLTIAVKKVRAFLSC